MKNTSSKKKEKKKIPLWLVLIAGGGLLISLLVIGLIVVTLVFQNTGTLNPTIEQSEIQLDNRQILQKQEPTPPINISDSNSSVGILSGILQGPFGWFVIIFVVYMTLQIGVSFFSRSRF